MADAYNPIEISNFPELTELLSSDKIILFEEVDGNIVPNLSSVIDLSSVALFPDDVDEIKEKVEQVKSDIRNAIVYFKKTFITKTDAATMFATLARLNAVLGKLETLEHFNGRLKNKATKEYLERLANKLRARMQRAKFVLGTDSWDRGKAFGYKRLLVAKAAMKGE